MPNRVHHQNSVKHKPVKQKPVNQQHAVRQQAGFGLVELMISIALGLFLISGAISVLFSTKTAYTLNKELALLQDNARFASRALNRDLRAAGFYGCARRQGFNSTLNPPPSGSGWHLNFNNPVLGWNGGAADYPTPEFPAAFNSGAAASLPTSDLFTIRRADGEEVIVVDNDPPNAAVIEVVGTHPFVSGEILVITDCEHTTVFQARPSNNPSRIVHNTGAATPGNCTRYLGHLPCSNHVSNHKIYRGSEGAFVVKMEAHAYYVASTASGVPAMFRRALAASSNNAVVEDEEFVRGVENIQVVYGFDSSGDGFADRYVHANEITAGSWGNVVSVRVHLLFRTTAQVADEPQTFRFFGATHTPADRFIRQEFISTISLRNQG